MDCVGDSRGDEWYTDLTCLAVDPTTNQVLALVAIPAPSAPVFPILPSDTQELASIWAERLRAHPPLRKI